jgi:hypothetical protein
VSGKGIKKSRESGKESGGRGRSGDGRMALDNGKDNGPVWKAHMYVTGLVSTI